MLASRCLQARCSEIGNGGKALSYSCSVATRALEGNVGSLVALEELVLHAMRNPSLCGPQGINRSCSFLFCQLFYPSQEVGLHHFKSSQVPSFTADPREGWFCPLNWFLDLEEMAGNWPRISRKFSVLCWCNNSACCFRAFILLQAKCCTINYGT